jgi:hypothetical protein
VAVSLRGSTMDSSTYLRAAIIHALNGCIVPAKFTICMDATGRPVPIADAAAAHRPVSTRFCQSRTAAIGQITDERSHSEIATRMLHPPTLFKRVPAARIILKFSVAATVEAWAQ